MKTMDIYDPLPQTDEEAVEYLPDFDPIVIAASRGLYHCRRALGDSIQAALITTIEAFVLPTREKDANAHP